MCALRAAPAGRFVYLWRVDVLGQAVPWLRAQQTGVPFQNIQSERPRPAREPRFDLDEVQRLLHLIGTQCGPAGMVRFSRY
jgi:LPS sulfotransferase NodH